MSQRSAIASFQQLPSAPSPALLAELARRHEPLQQDGPAALTRVGGRLEIHCAINPQQARITDAAAVATAFRGYEALLVKRGLRDAGLVSSTASGICGGVHATASSQCLEMALGLQPPPLGIVVRNLLLSCQYLDENPLQLFVFSGPDYSRETLMQTNPALWQRAERSPAQHVAVHGYQSIGAILADLDQGKGRLYVEAMRMVRLAREAYALIGGKYPHSESIVPGGVTLNPSLAQVDAFVQKLTPFADYAKRCIAIWDDVFEFLYEANPAYAEVGRTDATMLDFGQWDHDEAYDATYKRCDAWGQMRWSTPGAVIGGQLITTRLTELNCGLEEFVTRSYYEPSQQAPRYRTDPLGNAISANHPWNRDYTANAGKQSEPAPYSWASSMTWRGRVFEVGAYARIYISALAGRLPKSEYLYARDGALHLALPEQELPAVDLSWRAPSIWNALERHRARAYAVAFNYLVLVENAERARRLLRQGASTLIESFAIPQQGEQMGVGFCGAGRGFLAHWAVIRDGAFANYQISVPSRINAGPRSPTGEPGPIESAVLNTPILEDPAAQNQRFSGIDIVRAIQSFDPCMPCSAHLHVGDEPAFVRTITTSGP